MISGLNTGLKAADIAYLVEEKEIENQLKQKKMEMVRTTRTIVFWADQWCSLFSPGRM